MNRIFVFFFVSGFSRHATNGCTERLAPVFTNFFQCQVVDLQVLHAPAQLAPPAITPQHPPMQFAVALWIEPGSRVFETEICNSSGVRYYGLRFIMESNCSARLLLGSRPDRDWRGSDIAELGMNIWRHQFAASVLILSVLLSMACNKKKPQLPPQAQAPTITVPVPDEISETTPPPPPPLPPKQEESVVEPPKPKAPHRKKPAPPPASSPDVSTHANTTGNATIAASHPPVNPAEGAPDTAITADVSSQQVSQQKQTTAELLAATEKNLKSVNGKLNYDEQALVSQIKTYIHQSKQATSQNDFERAYNLATKARLLSDAMVKK